jgi:tRNA (cytidine32/uridine32-2'-O)-methyltransferase
MSLKNIRIVLVEPKHPGNIGATARAMKTMGLENLVLVKPLRFPAKEATERAVAAVDVLDNAVITDDLASALQGCKLVIGGSRRVRELPVPRLDAREVGTQVVREAAAGAPVAVLFGSEDHGLSNESLDACSYQLVIPTNPDFRSLNLASAVQIVCYEIFIAAAQSEEPEAIDPSEYPSHDELEYFYQRLGSRLEERDFGGPVPTERVLAKLRRLLTRARPKGRELQLLHGLVRLMRDERKPKSRGSS